MILTAGGYDSFLDLITVLLIFVFVIAITLFTTKYVANYQKVQNAGKNIEVLETYRISQSKYIQIVKIGAKYVAIAVSKDTVTLLTALEETDISINDMVNEGKSFKDILAGLKKLNTKNATETLEETELLEKTDSLEEEK
ncbi:MAG: flagellar biosynthetic protein FliO [Lachnospiraceae bacterium]|nr:flagellar biosynthetic protein FliO [Lachnospiraceae bacterium]